MEKENTPAPGRRTSKNDETQMLEEADILEVRGSTVPPIDAGWNEEEPPAEQPAPPRAASPAPAAARAAAIPRPPPKGRPAAPPPAEADPSAERWVREAEALATSLPTRAALLFCFQARVALDQRGDAEAATAAYARAAALAPDNRFVAMTRRWLAERRGDPDEILAAARAEIPLAGDASERAPLLWLIAGIEDAAGRAESAERAFREVVGLDPQDLGAHLALAAVARERGNQRAAAEAWETAAARTDDRVARGAFFTAAAGIREHALGDLGGARLAFQRSLEADPLGAAAQAALESLHLRAAQWTDHARALAGEADHIGEVDPGLGYHERAGDVFWECLGDGVAAARCYERAAALAPDVVPLGKLAALYEQEGRYQELVRIYEQLVDRIEEPMRRAGLLLRLGTVYEGRLGRPSDALRCYHAALEAAPTLAAAAHALTAHYQVNRRWADLAALLLVEANRIADPVQRASRYAVLAQLCEVHPDSTDDVAALYERALALDPGQSTAIDALDRIYRAAGRWEPLISLYEQQLAHAKSARRVRALRLALAQLYLERAGSPERAAAQLRAALGGAPADNFPVLAALARALADAGKWPEHVEVLAGQAQLLDDEEDVVATLYRIATVVETRLDDPVRALAAYQQVLARAPDHELALNAILRLQRAQSRWEDLIETERRLLAATERPEEAAAILFRIGQIAEDHLARADEAIAAYKEALARLPSYRLARVGLEGLLRARGAFGELAELLEQQAVTAPAPIDRARLLTQAAMLLELHAADAGGLERPAALYREALSAAPQLPAALWGLARIRERAGDWAAVAAAFEALAGAASEPPARARLLIRLARVVELHLGDPARAAQLYEQAMALEAGPAACFDRLRLALSETGDSVGWLEMAASATRDPRLASALLRLRAAAIEHGGGSADTAAEAYSASLRHSNEAQTLDGLARSLARLKNDPRLPAITAARARLLRDGPCRALLLCAAGALFEESDRLDEADGAYGDALASAPDFPPALDGRRRLRQKGGEWAEAAAAAASLASQMRDPGNQVEMYEEAARLCLERLGDQAAAVNHYRAVLAAQPGHADALARTLEILEESGAWADAAAVLSDQIEAITDEGVRSELLVRRAHILAERLGDVLAAINDVERAVRLRPGTPDLVRLLAELHVAAGHWADAARAYEKVAEAAPDPDTRRDALLAQARIWTERVPDYARAQRILAEASRLAADDRGVLSALASVSRHAGDHKAAADVYETLSRTGTAAERATSFLALADLRRQLGEDAAAEMAAASAFDLVSDEPAIASLLVDSYRERDDQDGFAEMAEAALRRSGRGGRPGHLALRLALAELYGGGERALEQLRNAVDSHPSSSAPRLALGRALVASDPQAAIGELRAVIDRDPTDPAAYAGLAEACARLDRDGAAALMGTAAALLGAGDLPGELQITLSVPPRPKAGSLPADLALELLIGKGRAAGVREVVARLDPWLHEIFPDGQELRESLAPLPDIHPAAGLAQRFAPALGVDSLEIYRGGKGDPPILLSDPRALTLGPDQAGDDNLSRAAFDVASALARLAGGSALGCAVPADQVQALLRIASDPDAEEDRELKKRFASAVPRRARKELERIGDEYGMMDSRAWAVWEEEERARGRRAGVLFSRDVRAAARSIAPEVVATRDSAERRTRVAASPVMLDALRFAASDACWELLLRVHGSR
jgi:tetratricopeptide (TPR) repeat protein